MTEWRLPTGATVKYAYRHYFSGFRTPYHGEMVWRELDLEGELFRWTYTRFGDSLIRDVGDLVDVVLGQSLWSASNADRVRVLDPFDNLTVYRFHNTINATSGASGEFNCTDFGECDQNWWDGILRRVDYYAGDVEDGTRLAKTLSYTYVPDRNEDDEPLSFRFRDPNPASPETTAYTTGYNVRLERVDEVMPGGSYYPATTTVTTSSDWTQTEPYLAKTISEYQGAALDRVTHYEWKHDETMDRSSYSCKIVTDGFDNIVSAMTTVPQYGGRLESVTRWSDVSGPWTGQCQPEAFDDEIHTHWNYDGNTGMPANRTVAGSDAGAVTIAFDYTSYGSLEKSQGGAFSWYTVDRTYHDLTGLVESSRRPDGVQTSYLWDQLGRLKRIDFPTDENSVIIAYPNLWETRVTQDDSEGFTELVFLYDSLGRLVEERRRSLESEAEATYDFRRTQYDVAGRVQSRSEWALGGTLDADLVWTNYEYYFGDTALADPLGRVSRVTSPDGSRVDTRYDGLGTIVTQYGIHGLSGSMTSTTVYERDARGRLVWVDSPGLGADAEYVYDDLNNLTNVYLVDPNPPDGESGIQTRTFIYDALSRLRVASHPENGTTVYHSYDARGNLLRYTDSNQEEFEQVYDSVDRLVSVSRNDGSTLLLQNTYDVGQGLSTGKLTKQESFDDDGQLVSTREWIYGTQDGEPCPGPPHTSYAGLNGRLRHERTTAHAPNGDVDFEVSYCYSPTGNVAKIDYPHQPLEGAASQVGYLYHNGMLWSVVDHSRERDVEYLRDIGYSPGGQVLSMVRGNDVFTTTSVDEMGRIQDRSVWRDDRVIPDRTALSSVFGCGGGQGIQSLIFCGNRPQAVFSELWTTGEYGYDGAGNVDSIGGDLYYYDELSRLVGAQIGDSGNLHTLGFEYDAYGNMRERLRQSTSSQTDEVRTFDVNPSTNQLIGQVHTSELGTTSYSYGYDPNGNLATDGFRGFHYDSRNRLTSVWNNASGEVGSYDYDGNGHRIRSEVGDVESFYLRDGSGRLLSEFRRQVGDTTRPEWDKDYIYALGRPINLVKNDVPAVPMQPWVENLDQIHGAGLSIHWSPVEELDIYQYYLTRTLQEEPGGSIETVGPVKVPGALTSWVESFPEFAPGAEPRITYKVQAVDQAINVSGDSPAVVVLPLGDPPDAPTDLTANPSDGTIELSWTAVEDDDLWGYSIKRLIAGVPGGFQTITPVPIAETSFWDHGLALDVTHFYRVLAVDTAGRESPTVGINAVPTDGYAPQTPVLLTASPGLVADTISLSWEAVADADTAEYRMYRRTASSSETLLDTGVELVVNEPDHPTAYVDHTALVTPGGYCYTLVAVDSSGNESNNSAEACAMPRNAGVPTPTLTSADFEVDLRGTTSTDGTPGPNVDGCDVSAEYDDVMQVRLTWSRPAFPPPPPATVRYRVYRAEPGSGEYNRIADLETSDATVVLLDTQVARLAYTYFVVAVDDEGWESPASDTIEEEIPHNPGAVVRNLGAIDGSEDIPWGTATVNRRSRQVRVHWSRVVDPLLFGYNVYRRCDWAGGEEFFFSDFQVVRLHEYCPDAWLRLTEQPVTGTHVYEDSTLGGLQGNYQYAIRPVWIDGTEGSISKVLTVTLPADPYEFDAGGPVRPALHCAADVETHDHRVSVSPSARRPTTEEVARINDASRGTHNPDGAPAGPEELWVRLFPGPGSGATDAPGYEGGTRASQHALLTWWYASTDDVPSDLAGFHVEMAGSMEGPWRRVTERPVAWWEREFRLPAVGVRRHKRRPEDTSCVPDAAYLDNEQCYSGHLDCVVFRIVAIDEDGEESPPLLPTLYPAEIRMIAHQVATECPQTLSAPQNLHATSLGPPGPGEEGSGPCRVQLEWDPVDGAHSYYIYRYVPGGFFFYQTQRQLATAGTVYIEAGDYDGGDCNPCCPGEADPDPDFDCPMGYCWNNLGGPVMNTHGCSIGHGIEAFFVTATRDVGGVEVGGESPRSNIVFWDCASDTGYTVAGLSPMPLAPEDAPPPGEIEFFLPEPGGFTPDETFLVADNVPAEDPTPDREPDPQVRSTRLAEPGSGANNLLLTAPFMTLGETSPPYAIFDLHLDHLGSVRAVTDDNGNVISEHKFFPFGEEVTPMLDYGTKMFTGHERDRETGLDYMMARYYSCSIGRFMSADPLNRIEGSEPQRWNRYTYVWNNPLILVDPTGEYPKFDLHRDVRYVDLPGDWLPPAPLVMDGPGALLWLGEGTGTKGRASAFKKRIGDSLSALGTDLLPDTYANEDPRGGRAAGGEYGAFRTRGGKTVYFYQKRNGETWAWRYTWNENGERVAEILYYEDENGESPPVGEAPPPPQCGGLCPVPRLPRQGGGLEKASDPNPFNPEPQAPPCGYEPFCGR